MTPVLPRRSTCRVLGHRPHVAGPTDDAVSNFEFTPRWVVCDRCGTHPEPRGTLDPRYWKHGAPYTGRFDNADDLPWYSWIGTDPRPRIATGITHNPGPWPTGPNRDGRSRLRLAGILERLGLPDTAMELRVRGLLAQWAHGTDERERMEDRLHAYVAAVVATRTTTGRPMSPRARAAVQRLFDNEDWW